MKLGKGDTVSVLTLLPAELSEEGGGGTVMRVWVCVSAFFFSRSAFVKAFLPNAIHLAFS